MYFSHEKQKRSGEAEVITAFRRLGGLLLLLVGRVMNLCQSNA